MTVAYTIGASVNYDRTLAAQAANAGVMRKTGKGDQGRDPEYPGGCVWHAPGEAHAAAVKAGARFAVYLLDLPGPWADGVYLTADDAGHHNLLVDAVILCKVTE